MKMEWSEIRPYMVSEDEVDGYKTLMDHAGRFTYVVHRDEGNHIRMLVGVPSDKASTVTMLNGMEVIRSVPFDCKGFKMYRRYKHKRHCAIPIADDTVERESIYRVLDREVHDPAFLAFNVRKTISLSRVHDYVRCLEMGQSPDSVFRFLSMGGAAPKKLSASRQSKIQMAKSKIGKMAHLFTCEIVMGSNSRQALASMDTIFPSGTMVPSTIGVEKAMSLLAKRPSPPFFGSSRHPFLSETEMLCIIGFPEEEDIQKTGIQHGKTSSYTSSRRFAGVDETVDLDT